jgi:alpha-glucoside transport system substrate-binding protein
LATPLSSGPSRAPVAADRPAVAVPPQPPVGTTVTVWGQEEGIEEEFARFEEETGIVVNYRPGDVHFDVAQLSSGVPGPFPDVVILPWQEQIRDLAASGRLVGVSAFLDLAVARKRFSDSIVDAMSVGSELYGVPASFNLKGLVWYPKQPFDAAGYTVPRSWDELLALSERMVADGQAPWCLGVESGGADGWPATDWIEALVLRIGGPAHYDRWVAHDIAFDDPVVRQAAAMFGGIVFGEGFVNRGAEQVTRIGYDEAADPMGTDPPGCWLYYMADFFADGIDVESLGTDIGVFELPPLVAGQPAPVLGGGAFAAALRDRPEVRELMRAMAGEDWGSIWAASGQPFLSPNTEFDPEACRPEGFTKEAGDVRVELCRITRDGLLANAWRFDGSDQMPVEVGAGTFWSGMVDFIDQGPDSLDRVLADIEASWPTEDTS